MAHRFLVALFYAQLLSINVHGEHHVELVHLAHADARRVVTAAAR